MVIFSLPMAKRSDFSALLSDGNSAITNSNLNMSFTNRVPVGTRRRTGQTCPESGVWRADSTPSTTAPISKGETMPPYRGKAVYWTLIQHA